MFEVKEFGNLGLCYNRKCSIVAIVCASIYFLISLFLSLLYRLYYKAYYLAAHQMSLGALAAIFVVSHHTFRVRSMLGINLKSFCILQAVLNVWCLLSTLVTAVAYSVLTDLSIHINYDYLTSATWCWATAFTLLYLAVMSIGGAVTHMYHRYTFYEINASGHFEPPIQMKSKASVDNNSGLFTSSLERESSSPGPSPCRSFSCCILRLFYWSLYLVFLVLVLLLFLLTAYQSCMMIRDTRSYREDEHMYTVHVEGHKPLSLYLKCRGTGNETILIENGLGGTALMYWHFIPRVLSVKYKVCVHDRRGYGWSETLEHDHFYKLKSEPQWTGTNTLFFRELIRKANVPTPFYLAGHSYGGLHITHTILNYPDLVKGLIYLDSVGFAVVDVLIQLMEIIANTQASGLLRAAIDTGILDSKMAFKGVIDFDSLTSRLKDELIASFKTGYFAQTYMRERGPLVSNFALDEMEKMIKGRIINVPVLVIDAGSRKSHDWFPGDYFPLYDPSNHFVVNGSAHVSLVLSEQYGNITSNLIDKFIESLV